MDRGDTSHAGHSVGVSVVTPSQDEHLEFVHRANYRHHETPSAKECPKGVQWGGALAGAGRLPHGTQIILSPK